MKRMMQLIIMGGPNRSLAVRRLIKEEGYDYAEVMAAYRKLQRMGLAPMRKGVHEFRNEFDHDHFEKAKSIRETYQDTRQSLYAQWDSGHPLVLRRLDGMYRSQERRGIFESRPKTPTQVMAGRWSTVPGSEKLGRSRTWAEEIAERREIARKFRGGGDR